MSQIRRWNHHKYHRIKLSSPNRINEQKLEDETFHQWVMYVQLSDHVAIVQNHHVDNRFKQGQSEKDGLFTILVYNTILFRPTDKKN